MKAAIVISDIRNFTGTFAKFEKYNSNKFNEFIADFHNIQIILANKISNEFWYNSLGDSMLFIFYGREHSKKAYTFAMALHKYLKKSCDDFNNQYSCDVSFGIGLDCGGVNKIYMNDGAQTKYTYLGNVINVASRIEKMTKNFGETEMLVGGNIYNYIMSELYPDVYNFDFTDSNYTEILRSNPSIILMSENILLYYIFKLKLEGIEKALPLFRYDNKLASEYIYEVIEKLVGEDIKNEIIEFFKTIGS
jgi:hypothetical protein